MDSNLDMKLVSTVNIGVHLKLSTHVEHVLDFETLTIGHQIIDFIVKL